MGRRARARGGLPALRAENVEYTDPERGTLVLRGSLTAPTRRRYEEIGERPSDTVEDSWQRRMEFLFERLAVRWVINDVATEGQRELLLRYRIASQEERRWIRDALREHIATQFPDVEAP